MTVGAIGSSSILDGARAASATSGASGVASAGASALAGTGAASGAGNAATATISNPFGQLATDLQSLLVQLQGGASQGGGASSASVSGQSTAGLGGAHHHGHHHGAHGGNDMTASAAGPTSVDAPDGSSGDLATDFADSALGGSVAGN